MGLRGLTIKGKTDGFGCQLNAKLSGIAFCFNSPRYIYVHTPFTSVSHGWRSEENGKRVNDFMNITEIKAKVHVSYKYMKAVFNDPNSFYNHGLLDHLRKMFWSNKEYEALEQITVHIRRGDIQPRPICKHRGGYLRHQNNEFYSRGIPKVASHYPDSYPIVIHSEGNMEEFQSIKDGCPDSISERMIFKLGKESDPTGCEHNMLSAFYEMVASKVFVQSKSGLSYTAGMFNGHDVYIPNGRSALGQKHQLQHWKRF
tara:strand:- start:658 stop:1428 length:771 start_codon:yes stop_codon:yes gene_type:complete